MVVVQQNVAIVMWIQRN